MCDDDSPVICCHECCSVTQNLCALCDKEIHKWHPLNDREFWNGEYFTFIPLPPDHINGNLIDIGMYVHNYCVDGLYI